MSPILGYRCVNDIRSFEIERGGTPAKRNEKGPDGRSIRPFRATIPAA
jgi:hypothetical protein